MIRRSPLLKHVISNKLLINDDKKILIFFYRKLGGTSPRSGGSGAGPEIGSLPPKSGAITCLSEHGICSYKTHNTWEKASTPNCVKHFQWLIELFWPIMFDVTITVSIGTVVKSNLIGQNHLVNQGNPLYN